MAVSLIFLKDLLTGETGGGTFALTNVTNYPTTFGDWNDGNDVTITSPADLPYVFDAYLPSYDTAINFENARGGIYTFTYCVTGCTTACTSVDLTVVEVPVVGAIPAITRCGVNGVYGSTSVCYTGEVTRNSDGGAYNTTLLPLTWSKDAWTATGNCVSIPNTVTPGLITITATSLTGACVGTYQVSLIQSNVYAGNTATKKLCIDKHQLEVYKNTPGGGVNIGVVNLDTELFTGTGESVPPGAMKTWTLISGPSAIPFTTNNKADFRNALIGNYVFRKTVTLNGCTHSTDYNVIMKFCTTGDQVAKINTVCKLNTTFTMINDYASFFNSTFNPIVTGGCWIYLNGTTQLDIEINGIPYTNYNTLDKFPYNAIVKITSQGKYEFEFDTAGGGSNPGGCVATSVNAECDCDYFSTFNSSGTYVIDTTVAAPDAGTSKFYPIGCGTRQVSLFAKHNELNGGTLAGGGVWTYEAVQLPITFLVNGVSTTFTSYGQVVPGGSDPLIDLSGLPNPLNVQFKYTVTNSCGTDDSNFTINITCNNCNKVVNTTMNTSTCDYNLSIVNPSTFATDTALWELVTNQSYINFKAIKRLTGSCGSLDQLQNYTVPIRLSQSTGTMNAGGRLTSIKLVGSSPNETKVITLTPSTYLSGCPGVPNVNAAHLTLGGAATSSHNIAIRNQIRHAIYANFSGTTSTSASVNVEVTLSSGGIYQIKVTTNPKHASAARWVSLPTVAGEIKYIPTAAGAETTITSIEASTGLTEDIDYGIVSPCGKSLKKTFSPALPFPINLGASTPTNLVLSASIQALTQIVKDDTVLTSTCKAFNFATTVTPPCGTTPAYSYKVNGVALPETTATFTRKPFPDAECNPFNSGATQSLETTVSSCDGCPPYIVTPLTFC